jgi:hypothetical protein
VPFPVTTVVDPWGVRSTDCFSSRIWHGRPIVESRDVYRERVRHFVYVILVTRHVVFTVRLLRARPPYCLRHTLLLPGSLSNCRTQTPYCLQHARLTIISNRVSSGEWDDKGKNQLIHYTQWLKCYHHTTVGKAGASPIIRIFFYFHCIPKWSDTTNYINVLHSPPIHPEASGSIGPPVGVNGTVLFARGEYGFATYLLRGGTPQLFFCDATIFVVRCKGMLHA